jgi:RimJ/RimL family protein N-acetyltransferase
MILQKYNCKLVRLTVDKIEMVRNWRNSSNVSMYMEYRETITTEMQLNWFNKINNNQNYYFIAEYNNEEVGLINLKDVDCELGCAEGGIFIANESYLNSDVSFRMSLALTDFGFEYLDLKYIIAHILKDNIRAIKYNKTLGFELEPNQELSNNQKYILTKENYYKKWDFITRIL